MDIFTKIGYWSKQLIAVRKLVMARLLMQWMFLSAVIISCKTDPHLSNWVEEDSLTISQYLEKNQEEYSKFIMLLKEGKLFGTLYAYNPYGEDYTLFLPTDKAIDQFIQQNQDYGNFDELLKDTSFIKKLTRYHTVNRKLHTDEFPDGALTDVTLTGDRLVIGFSTDGNNQLINVNNEAQITESNLKMTNGYIHVISGVLEQAEISGYDWLQQQKDYSILAQAVKLSNIKSRLWWKKYTLLAERDSIYRRRGIYTVEDLIKRIATPGMPVSDKNNAFYQFTAFHFVGGEYYMNDFSWGNKKYTTLSTGYPLTVNVGVEIHINPGVDTYSYIIPNTGDTTLIDYILPRWKDSNVMTTTGPVHSISEVLYFKPLP